MKDDLNVNSLNPDSAAEQNAVGAENPENEVLNVSAVPATEPSAAESPAPDAQSLVPQQQYYGQPSAPPPQYYGQPPQGQPYYPPAPSPYPYAPPPGYYPAPPRKKKKTHTLGAVTFTLTMVGSAVFLLLAIIYWPIVLFVISILEEGDVGGVILGALFGAPLAIIMEIIVFVAAGIYLLLSLAVIILFIVGLVRKAAKKHLLIAGFIINFFMTGIAVLQVILMLGYGFFATAG